MTLREIIRSRRGAIAAALAVALSATAAAPAAAATATTATGGSPVTLSPAITAAPTELTLNLDPSAVAAQAQSPTAASLLLPRGMAFDTRARSARCTPAQASALNCPEASNIGFGHGVVNVAGYLHPGGDADVVSYVRAFLGEPTAPGDPASVVFEVQLLGVDRIQQAIQQNFGIWVPFADAVTARLQRVASGPYGYQLDLGGLPGGITLPPALADNGVSATFNRLKLQLGAVRFHRHNFVHVFRVATPNGPRTFRVPDHKLIGRYLLRDPQSCHGTWPFALALTFPAGTQQITSRVACRRGAVPTAPPPSPSAPQSA